MKKSRIKIIAVILIVCVSVLIPQSVFAKVDKEIFLLAKLENERDTILVSIKNSWKNRKC
ncbi:hypothetical protein [Desulfitibacter alkalitolerans]|uniref:hypothetical protein n=1 Tax=Desulfitibacter alkalitolerans TaxID=264641 RepID=UPI0004884DCD|nr:hypothetical protein [Desulfitibacter alkalitolerans]